MFTFLPFVDLTPEDRGNDREGIVARVIRYTLDDPQRVGHGEVHTVITNLFDEDLYPTKELIMLYHERWEQEDTMDPGIKVKAKKAVDIEDSPGFAHQCIVTSSWP